MLLRAPHARSRPAVTAGADPGWIREHAGDLIPVKLTDLLSVVERLSQVQAEGDCGTVVHDRLFTCDLPRLRRYLPERALREL
jgi:hypothetical protein